MASASGLERQRGKAYELLRRELLGGRLREGERLRETEWAPRLGVNRVALREALARLHSEGLVVEGAKTGYFVPRMTENDRQEILEVRLMAEQLAVARLIHLGSSHDVDLRPLHELCDEMEWLLSRGYSVNLGELDGRFHETLVQLSCNRRLTLLHRCLPQLDWLHESLATPAGQSVGRRVLEDHRMLLEAIQAGELPRAHELLTAHFNTEEADGAAPVNAAPPGHPAG